MSYAGQLRLPPGVRPPYPGPWLSTSVRSCGETSLRAVRVPARAARLLLGGDRTRHPRLGDGLLRSAAARARVVVDQVLGGSYAAVQRVTARAAVDPPRVQLAGVLPLGHRDALGHAVDQLVDELRGPPELERAGRALTRRATSMAPVPRVRARTSSAAHAGTSRENSRAGAGPLESDRSRGRIKSSGLPCSPSSGNNSRKSAHRL